MNSVIMATLPVDLSAVGTNIEEFHLSKHPWRDFFHPDSDSISKQQVLGVKVVKAVEDFARGQRNVVHWQLTEVSKVLCPSLLHVERMYAQVPVSIADLHSNK